MSALFSKIPPYVVLDKQRGETPLQALEAWKYRNPEYQDVPASYAGRLDPMAEGKLLVLLGEECKKQNHYIMLDKQYVIEVVLDLGTDTGDVLGLAQYAEKVSRPTRTALLHALSEQEGSYSRRYPAFSSKTVNGKPLFVYALEGTLNTIKIPEHRETFYTVSLQKSEFQSTAQVQTRITEALAIVPRSDEPSKLLGADFRQDLVRETWKKVFATIPQREFMVLTLQINCASGAYMRTLAERIGREFGTDALALSIRRTKLGKYKLFFRNKGFWISDFS